MYQTARTYIPEDGKAYFKAVFSYEITGPIFYSLQATLVWSMSAKVLRAWRNRISVTCYTEHAGVAATL
jgi:hypothetical protein